MDGPLHCRFIERRLVPVVFFHPLGHVVALDPVRHTAEVLQCLVQAVEEVLHLCGQHRYHEAHHREWEDAHQDVSPYVLTRLTVGHPQRVSGEVSLHLLGRLVSVMELVVVILLVFLDHQLELRVSVRIVSLLAIVLVVQDLIGHILAGHPLSVFFKMLLKEGIAILVAVPVRILLAQNRIQLRLVCLRELQEAAPGCLGTVPIHGYRAPAQAQLPFDFTNGHPFG